MGKIITITNASFLVGGVIVLVYIVSLIRVMNYENKINKLHKNKRGEIEQIKSRPVSMSIINGRIGQVEEKYKPEIEKLERKRRFILEKLPLIKK